MIYIMIEIGIIAACYFRVIINAIIKEGRPLTMRKKIKQINVLYLCSQFYYVVS